MVSSDGRVWVSLSQILKPFFMIFPHRLRSPATACCRNRPSVSGGRPQHNPGRLRYTDRRPLAAPSWCKDGEEKNPMLYVDPSLKALVQAQLEERGIRSGPSER